MTEFELGRDFLLGLMPEEGIRKIIGDALPHPKEGSGIPRAELYLYVGIPPNYKNTIMQGIALSVFVIGMAGALKSNNILLVIFSLSIGSIVGEKLKIENKLEQAG
ncbi:MAG: DUF554 family protein, partial [Alkaliphilus sp.]